MTPVWGIERSGFELTTPIVDYERGWLREHGRGDLADRVRWTAREDGDGLGYDVLSYDTNGHERHIEVKTTALGAEAPFYIPQPNLNSPDATWLLRTAPGICGTA
jgi:hypothetical protein